MERTLASFRRLTTAEEYLEFFEIPYDPAVVAVNRLHILKRFSEYLAAADAGEATAEADPDATLKRYREALLRAYQDFLTGSALDYRLFKVLKEHAPGAFVPLSSLAGVPPDGAGAVSAEGREGR